MVNLAPYTKCTSLHVHFEIKIAQQPLNIYSRYTATSEYIFTLYSKLENYLVFLDLEFFTKELSLCINIKYSKANIFATFDISNLDY